MDPREKRIALSIKALRRTEEREDVDAHMKRERDGSKFSLADVMSEDLRVDHEARDKDKA